MGLARRISSSLPTSRSLGPQDRFSIDAFSATQNAQKRQTNAFRCTERSFAGNGRALQVSRSYRYFPGASGVNYGVKCGKCGGEDDGASPTAALSHEQLGGSTLSRPRANDVQPFFIPSTQVQDCHYSVLCTYSPLTATSRVPTHCTAQASSASHAIGVKPLDSLSFLGSKLSVPCHCHGQEDRQSPFEPGDLNEPHSPSPNLSHWPRHRASSDPFPSWSQRLLPCER